jgi:hypothetical protein
VGPNRKSSYWTRDRHQKTRGIPSDLPSRAASTRARLHEGGSATRQVPRTSCLRSACPVLRVA